MIILDNKIMQHLDCYSYNAHKFIYVSSFKAEIPPSIHNKKLFAFWNNIFAAGKRGVDVRFLLNWNNLKKGVAKTNLLVANALLKSGCKVKYLKNNRCCHAKLFIFDQACCIIGSHNLSAKSVKENFEMSYLVNDPVMVKEAKDIYETLWNDAKSF